MIRSCVPLQGCAPSPMQCWHMLQQHKAELGITPGATLEPCADVTHQTNSLWDTAGSQMGHVHGTKPAPAQPAGNWFSPLLAKPSTCSVRSSPCLGGECLEGKTSLQAPSSFPHPRVKGCWGQPGYHGGTDSAQRWRADGLHTRLRAPRMATPTPPPALGFAYGKI